MAKIEVQLLEDLILDALEEAVEQDPQELLPKAKRMSQHFLALPAEQRTKALAKHQEHLAASEQQTAAEVSQSLGAVSVAGVEKEHEE